MPPKPDPKAAPPVEEKKGPPPAAKKYPDEKTFKAAAKDHLKTVQASM
jgi:hypothetical protein